MAQKAYNEKPVGQNFYFPNFTLRNTLLPVRFGAR